MELKQFVKEALLSIIEGVDEANSKHKRCKIIGVKRNDGGLDGNFIDFDVSVVVEQKSSGKVGGKIDTSASILSVVSVSANIDSNLDQTNSLQNINHLKFKVWISENKLE